MVWERPSSVAYPAVWSHCVGKKALPGGRIPKFRIQDAPPEMFEEIVDHMISIFLKSEPISVYTEMSTEPQSVTEARDFWMKALHKKMVLVALYVEDDGTTKLAGVNMTCPSVIEEKNKLRQMKGVANRTLFGIIEHLYNLVDVFAHYGVTEYMTAMGLSVAPEYRGQGLGLELLLARIPLCKATGLTVTSTVFTADNSQELARRAGFELLAEVEYQQYKVANEEVFPGINIKYCKMMALKIQ